MSSSIPPTGNSRNSLVNINDAAMSARLIWWGIDLFKLAGDKDKSPWAILTTQEVDIA
jgi:hypothetical protein